MTPLDQSNLVPQGSRLPQTNLSKFESRPQTPWYPAHLIQLP